MFSLNRRRRTSALAAFTLIELAIVLGVVGVVGGGMWRLMSNSGQQTKDSATAAQQGALINAVKGYLASAEGQSWMGTTMGSTLGNPANLPLPVSSSPCSDPTNPGLCSFLPAGFTNGTQNPYGQKYTIQVLKDGTTQGIAPVTYSFMIVASGVTIPDANGGRISNLIGGDGGFVYANVLCSTAATVATTACGALGAWSDSITTYGFNPLTGAIASRTFVSASTNSSMQWLSRIFDTDINHTLNTMTADIIMGAWQGAATPLSGSTVAPSIHLQNGVLDGSGLAPANTADGQIALNRTTTSAAPLIYLTTGCTALTTAGCAVALNISVGDVGIGGAVTATKVYSASDARLKTNIHRITDGLTNVMKLDAVSFAFKEGGKPSMGVIAQDLEKVYPQLVLERDGTKFVEYTGLIAPLISAVQELKHQNDDLRAQLKKQADREDGLERQLKAKSTAP